MNLVEYKNVAPQRLNKTIENNPNESMRYSCMGLIEETGEIIAELRKPLFKGNFHEKTLDIPSIKSELGDLIWYMALMCKDYNINIEALEKFEIPEKQVQLPKREEIIKVAINMGQSTGKIVQECMRIYYDDENDSGLTDVLSEQYKNINELANILGIDIGKVLDENVEKINSRYTEKGDVSR